MHFYRMAYEYPDDPIRRRATFVAPTPFRAVQFAGDYCRSIKARLLSLKLERKAEINDVLELT